MACGVAIAFLGGRASASQAHASPQRVIVVHPGDTVWSIAQRVVGPSGDPRPMVQALVVRNHLHDAVITAGERLAVPA